MLLIDAANVVGSRPSGWWRDRPGAARRLVEQVRAATEAGRLPAPVTIVLEGQARAGVEAGAADGLEVVHASGSGDDELVSLAGRTVDGRVTVVTADRGLRERVRDLGAEVLGPSWLLERLEGDQRL